ncbi:hypothetical protein ABPG72_012171 [Tetrahymena utriculariae]
MEQWIQQLDYGDNEFYNFSTFFKPIKMIGQGAFGKVIKAIDNSTNQEVAIKVINKKKMGEDCIEKVKQEARILEKLNHPNVVEFKKVCETETKILIAMELVRGGSLSQLMKERKSKNDWFKEKEVSQIMKSIMLGLVYIHGKNIVHRDLKPENILINDVNDFTSIKIADFGLSSAFSLWTTNGLTEQCGTLLYMAPEFFASRVYSKQIDIWSCGITMHNLLDYGNHPFYEPKADDADIFKQKLSNPKWKIPAHFSNLAKNLLSKLSLINPTERYSAIQALQHPFITENLNGAIPMTMNEQLLSFKIKESLIQKLKMMVFIQYVKSKQNDQDQGKLKQESLQKLEQSEKKAQYLQDSVISKQRSDCSIDWQEKGKDLVVVEPFKGEETNSNRKFKFKTYSYIPQNNTASTTTSISGYNGNKGILHFQNKICNQEQSNNSSSNISFNIVDNTQNNLTNLSRKPPLKFMIKKQKSLNPDQPQQIPSQNLQKKRNSVLNNRQDFTDGSILIEIQENPLDQQGSYSEKTFKRNQVFNQNGQQHTQLQPNQYLQVKQNFNNTLAQAKKSSVISQNSPGKPLTAVQLNRPSTISNQQKKKVNIHHTPPLPTNLYHNKKDSTLGYLKTANTPKNSKESNNTNASLNTQNLRKQMRIKSATRLKQDPIANTKRRNSNLNQISQIQIIKKAIESQDLPINLLETNLLSPNKNCAPSMSPNFQKENRNCVSSLQTQNSSAKKPPLKQFQTQDCSAMIMFNQQNADQFDKQNTITPQDFKQLRIKVKPKKIPESTFKDCHQKRQQISLA